MRIITQVFKNLRCVEVFKAKKKRII